jgi:hypothetical protein
MLFHPDRRLPGREDQVERSTTVIAVAGKREQALRFDPFSMGAHYHIRPGLADQIPLPVAEGQCPLDAVLPAKARPRTPPPPQTDVPPTVRYPLFQHRTRSEILGLAALLSVYAILARYLIADPAVAANTLATLRRAFAGGSAVSP